MFVVNNTVDLNLLYEAGVSPDQIQGVKGSNTGLPDFQGTNGVYVGAAGRYAPHGATVLQGATRVQTAQLIKTYQGTNGDLSATGIAHSILDPLGLGSLTDWAIQEFQKSNDWNYVATQVPEQQAFKDRYPQYAVLRATGDPVTVNDIQNYEKQAADFVTQYGLEGMDGYSPQQIAQQAMIGHISVGELQQRLDLRQAAAAQYHPDVAAQLGMLGLEGDKALTAYALDPKAALPALQQKILAAQDAASAKSTGFGQLTADQATGLAQQGVTQGQAQSGFGQLAQLGQLRTALPGESGQGISADTMISAQFQGNAADTQAIQAEQARRLAAFQNRGGPAGNQQGLLGSGSAAV